MPRMCLTKTCAEIERAIASYSNAIAQKQSVFSTSVVTSKAAMRGQLKTGHARKPSGTDCSTLPPVEEASLFLCASFADRI